MQSRTIIIIILVAGELTSAVDMPGYLLLGLVDHDYLGAGKRVNLGNLREVSSDPIGGSFIWTLGR